MRRWWWGRSSLVKVISAPNIAKVFISGFLCFLLFVLSGKGPGGSERKLETPLEPTWVSGVSSQGFLEVSKVLKDPRTTQDPISTGKVEEPVILHKQTTSEHEGKKLATNVDILHQPSDIHVKDQIQIKPTEAVIFESKKIQHKLQPSKKLDKFAQFKARIKIDIEMNQSDVNSTDFKHVMMYNENFVPHVTKDLVVPGYKVDNGQQRCPDNGTNVTLVVLVISAPGHARERDAIRAGWGRHGAAEHIVFAFLLGTPQEERDMQQLLEENNEHGDLVINNVDDVYENLSLKTLSGLKWFYTRCGEARYLLKVDDDMFVQTDRLIELLSQLDKSSRLILGNISRGWKPVRNPRSKYYITEKQFDKERYPDFATGPSYVVSGNAVRSLYEAAMEEKYVHLEDVFVTGIVAERVGVPRQNVEEFKNNANRIPARFMGCTLLHTITIHKVRPEEQEEFEQLARNPVCGPRQKPKVP